MPQPAVSGLGPGVFGASMAAGRFLGQAATRVSDRALLAGGAAPAAVGCVVVALAPGRAARARRVRARRWQGSR